MSARDDLGAWMRANVSDELQPVLSKLVAGYVAESVRADRQKHTDEQAAKDRAREAVRKVSDLAAQDNPLEQMRRMGEEYFGGRR